MSYIYHAGISVKCKGDKHMAKKKNGLLKFIVGVGAAAVAGKVAYDKVKAAKNKLTKEEQDSAELEVRKYNAVCEKRDVEIEDEEFMGCEVKAIASSLQLIFHWLFLKRMFILTLKV